MVYEKGGTKQNTSTIRVLNLFKIMLTVVVNNCETSIQIVLD